MEKQFQNLDIQFSIPQNELPKLTIKFWDFPIGRLIKASTAERISYARLLHCRLDDLLSFMGDVDVSDINLGHDISNLQKNELAT